jgi:polyisoprenyl-teichoic acid--peptidoglycan teichoic acid transferase
VRPHEPIGPPGDEGAEPSGSDERQHEAPPPATWAGRERAGGAASEDDSEAAADEDAGGERSPEDVDAGPIEASEDEADRGIADGDGAEDDREGAGQDDREGPEREPGGGGVGGAAVEAEGVASQDTVEADTLALGDREEAEEAALTGLRARAAEYAAKRKAQAPAPAAEAAAGEAAPTPEAAPTAVAEAPATPQTAGEAPRPRALWARFLAASLLIVISTATATSVSLLLVLTDLAQGLGGIPGIERELATVGGGDPQTILILGSDERENGQGEEGGARSDTVILLRVDPDRDAIGLLSIPRDLKVNIPGLGVEKFNAAYSHGGPKLTLRVVKQLTDLDINHVVNVDFLGFIDAVDAIDCVFIDADRRYFIPPETDYAEINIEAGYQRLCGHSALQYVRFRHDDNDLVRAARQQDFLREARQKIPPSRLVSDRRQLIDIFKRHTTSDQGLENPIELLELMKTFLAARHASVNEVHFPAKLGGPNAPYVTASRKEIRETVKQFLGTRGTPGPKPGSARAQERSGQRGDDGGDRAQEPDPGPEMMDAPTVGEYAQLVAAETSSGGRRWIDFPVFYPTEVPARTTFNRIDDSRAYPYDGPENEKYEAYKLVFGIPGSAGFSEHWGVSGTNWVDPPILQNPSEVREIGGRDHLLFYDGDRLRLVGWKHQGASYWVNNTLLQSLNENEMLAIARSMRRLDD